jgi:hypothetical protein
VTFDEKLQRVETGPTALVRVLDVFDGTADDDGRDITSFQVWLGPDSDVLS